MKKISSAFIASSLLLMTLPAMADSPWLIRLRAIDVIPSMSSSTISVIGGEVTHASKQVVPELDFSYFFTPHIAAELILATSRHSAEANNTSLGQVDLGKVSVLPPTLTAQYHVDINPKVKPYVGGGLNYTRFYNVNHGPVATDIHYGSSVGPALQAGVDIAVKDGWFINADIKKIWIKPKVTVYTTGAQLETNVHINPWVVGVGVGYRA